ncbi:MAG: deoxyribose-phosphate aldolase [Pseudomonadota bacterium]
MDDELIAAITKRVKEVLEKEKSQEKPRGFVEGQACNATSSDCAGHGKCANRKDHTMKRMIEMGAARFGAAPGLERPPHDIARRIDHTLLKPDATKEELDKLCDEAMKYHFATCCVNAVNVAHVAKRLKGSDVKAIAVVGFPLGASTTNAKVYEAIEAVRNGAQEIDMVINVGALKSQDYTTVSEDIRKVVEASAPKKVKVILETSLLNQEQKIAGCVLSKAAGAAFVKTSTGFGPGGATVDDITLMRRVVGEDMEVKASGGIRTREDALKMLDAGADRIGASASIAIVEGKKGGGGY